MIFQVVFPSDLYNFLLFYNMISNKKALHIKKLHKRNKCNTKVTFNGLL